MLHLYAQWENFSLQHRLNAQTEMSISILTMERQSKRSLFLSISKHIEERVNRNI